jgi:hypothetical protein
MPTLTWTKAEAARDYASNLHRAMLSTMNGARIAKHYSYATIAKRSGVDVATVHSTLTGTNMPGVLTYFRIAHALDCRPRLPRE